MPNTVLGKVSVVPKGDYSASTTYYALDIVGYNGGSYLAMQQVTGVTPSNDGVNWMQLSGPGLPGVDGVTFTPSVSEAGVISWTNDGEEENPDPVDIMGPPGAAAGFGTVTATADNTSSETPSVDVQSSGPDTAKNFTFAFTGLKGKPGETPDIEIGTVNTLEPGQDATADITGTTPNLTLSLGIPKGQPGTSVSRIQRTSGTGAAGTTDTYTMYDSNDDAIGTFTVYNGANGAGVTSFNGRTGAVTPQEGDYTANMVGARPDTWTPSAADVGAVPTSRTVNGKALSSNITLDADDVGALDQTSAVTLADARYLQLSGGTMTGAIALPGNPTSDNQAANKAYVDALKPNRLTVTLSASGWSGNSQTITVNGVITDTSAQDIDIACADKASADAWAAGGVWCSNPTQANKLTFTCTTPPTAPINLNIRLWEVG